MKYIKTYEEINIDKPQIGDYVILDKTFDAEFCSNNIGQIIKADPEVSVYFSELYGDHDYIVKYENMPKEPEEFIGDKTFTSFEWILYWSKNKEELEAILASSKYNL